MDPLRQVTGYGFNLLMAAAYGGNQEVYIYIYIYTYVIIIIFIFIMVMGLIC